MSSAIETIDSGTLIVDLEFYPRNVIDDTHIRDMVDAHAAGAVFPPIVAERSTRRVVDGVHRLRMAQRVGGPNAPISVIWRDYASDAEFFLDAVRLNSGHGRRFSHYDWARCAVRAQELHIEHGTIAAALHITTERLAEIEIKKTATGPDLSPMPIKRTADWLAGTQLTPEQVEGNKRASGHPVLYHVNQVISAIDTGLIDWSNPKLVESLRVLIDKATSALNKQNAAD